jgi:PAS domain S-box-containing protein
MNSEITSDTNNHIDYKELFNLSPIPLLLIDTNGVIIEINQLAIEFLGYNKNHLLQKQLASFFQMNSSTLFNEYFKKIQLNDCPLAQEFDIHLINNQTKFVKFDSKKLKFKDTIHFFLSITDLTKQKLSENQLKYDIEQSNLFRQHLAIFLANLSHEIRTPLNAVIGGAQILQLSDEINEKTSEVVNIISQNSDHLLNSINDILDITKIELSKLEIEYLSIHTNSFINEIKLLFISTAAIKHLDFKIYVHSKIPNLDQNTPPEYFIADKKRLKQIIINLLTNAFKFTKHGTVSIEFEFKLYQLNICVSDSGRGIIQHDIDKIFDPFQQLGDHRSIEGAGLGLTITKKLIDLMNGEIKVSSELEKGSKFLIKIPIELSTSPKLIDSQTVINPKKIVGYKGKRLKVLIVDDIDVNRYLLKDVLQKLDFQTLEAGDGLEALKLSIIHLPDIILMDLRMPIMDGIESTIKIRENIDLIKSTIIGISASLDITKTDFLIQRGFNSFILKPFKIADFLNILQNECGIEWIKKD